MLTNDVVNQFMLFGFVLWFIALFSYLTSRRIR